jgi:hypothetical protein
LLDVNDSDKTKGTNQMLNSTSFHGRTFFLVKANLGKGGSVNPIYFVKHMNGRSGQVRTKAPISEFTKLITNFLK